MFPPIELYFATPVKKIVSLNRISKFIDKLESVW